jgi:hypothetical protein
MQNEQVKFEDVIAEAVMLKTDIQPEKETENKQ